MIRRPIRDCLALVVALACGSATTLADFDNIYSAGHADLGVGYEQDTGELFLHYHFIPGSVVNGAPLSEEAEYEPESVTTLISDLAKILPGVSLPFLGNDAGAPIWVLPAINTPGLPFFGFGTEELDPADWSPVTFRLTGFSGPGNFALWQTSSIGTPIVRWQSSDGITAADSFDFGAGGHDHYNWGFTQAGIYDLGVSVSAVFNGQTYTDSGTFRFRVVPEPASLALVGLGLGAIGLAGLRRPGRAARN